MNNRYKKAMDAYANTAIEDERVMNAIRSARKKNPWRRGLVAAVAAAALLSTFLAAGAATDWSFFSGLFKEVMDDPISAELVEAGKMQELNIVNENEVFSLKLTSFTGDKETQVVLFELTPKEEWGEFDTICLTGRTVSPSVIEAGNLLKYGETDVEGYELTYENNRYYFRYRLPVFWVKDNPEDVVLHINRLSLYNKGIPVKSFICDMPFRFAPDRDMLQDPLVVAINQSLTKEIFDTHSFFEDKSGYAEYMMDMDKIVAPRSEGAMQLDEVVFSMYATDIHYTIQEEGNTETEVFNIRAQFCEPVFVTQHYWDGLEKKSHYILAAVDNTHRIRLFADDVEVPVIEESLRWLPGRGHDENGAITEGDYRGRLQFEGIDYENAQTVELRFGDTVIPLK